MSGVTARRTTVGRTTVTKATVSAPLNPAEVAAEKGLSWKSKAALAAGVGVPLGLVALSNPAAAFEDVGEDYGGYEPALASSSDGAATDSYNSWADASPTYELQQLDPPTGAGPTDEPLASGYYLRPDQTNRLMGQAAAEPPVSPVLDTLVDEGAVSVAAAGNIKQLIGEQARRCACEAPATAEAVREIGLFSDLDASGRIEESESARVPGLEELTETYGPAVEVWGTDRDARFEGLPELRQRVQEVSKRLGTPGHFERKVYSVKTDILELKNQGWLARRSSAGKLKSLESQIRIFGDLRDVAKKTEGEILRRY